MQILYRIEYDMGHGCQYFLCALTFCRALKDDIETPKPG